MSTPDLLTVEEEMRHLGNLIDQYLQDRFGRKGFALLVFEFNAPGIGNYISNCNREDMIKSLEETAERLRGRQDIPAAHPTKQ